MLCSHLLSPASSYCLIVRKHCQYFPPPPTPQSSAIPQGTVGGGVEEPSPGYELPPLCAVWGSVARVWGRQGGYYSDLICDVMITSSSSPSRRLLLSPVLCINDGGRAEVLLKDKNQEVAGCWILGRYLGHLAHNLSQVCTSLATQHQDQLQQSSCNRVISPVRAFYVL